MYATLKNNTLIPSPRTVRTPGRVICNPGPEMLRELGYKEVIYPAAEALDDVGLTPGSPLRAVYTENEEHIYVSYLPAEPAPAPDPAILREQAYRAEADQYLIAYNGYLLEGKTAQAEEQKDLYLECKSAIREQYPNIE